MFDTSISERENGSVRLNKVLIAWAILTGRALNSVCLLPTPSSLLNKFPTHQSSKRSEKE